MRKNIERRLYEEVIIGFDDQTMNIGVKKYDGNENVKSYKFYSRMKNGWEIKKTRRRMKISKLIKAH